jgi:hypothetical protein
VCSNCWSTAGNDGARQNRIAEVPSQHDCFVIELRAACGPASVFVSVACIHCHASIFGPMPRQRCQPIHADPPGALVPAVSFFGGFRTPALVPVDRSALAGIRNPSQNLPPAVQKWNAKKWNAPLPERRQSV